MPHKVEIEGDGETEESWYSVPDAEIEIRDNYDPSLLGMARRYTRTEERKAAQKQHLALNLRAKRYRLTPLTAFGGHSGRQRHRT